MKTITFNKANWTGETGELKAFKSKVKIPELNMEISFKEEDFDEETKHLLGYNIYRYTLEKWDGRTENMDLGSFAGKTPEEAHEMMAQNVYNLF